MIPSISPRPSAVTSLRSGLARSMQRLDAAAGRIAGAGLGEPAVPASATPEVDLPDAMLDVLVAQRAFMAQWRALEVAAAMGAAAVRIGQGPDAPRTTP